MLQIWHQILHQVLRFVSHDFSKNIFLKIIFEVQVESMCL